MLLRGIAIDYLYELAGRPMVQKGKGAAWSPGANGPALFDGRPNGLMKIVGLRLRRGEGNGQHAGSLDR